MGKQIFNRCCKKKLAFFLGFANETKQKGEKRVYRPNADKLVTVVSIFVEGIMCLEAQATFFAVRLNTQTGRAAHALCNTRPASFAHCPQEEALRA